jgi:pyruvyl transferase EpsO
MTPVSPVLISLKNRLLTIANKLDTTSRFIYVDYPLHPNIGDLLIHRGTEEFFSEHRMNIWRRYSYHDFPSEIPGVNDSDVFIFHGGGNFGDLYPEHPNLLLRILSKYPRNQVVVMPQTVFFRDKQNRDEVYSKLRSHARLSVYARDMRSLDDMRNAGITDVEAMPDMAHQLVGQLAPNPSAGSNEALYFIRRDEEAGAIPDSVGLTHQQTVDWVDCITLKDRLAFSILIRFVRASNAMGRPIDPIAKWYKMCDSMISSGVGLISRSERIYTNRLHAVLLALLLGREVVAFDNSYGKLHEYCNTWLADVEQLTFLEMAKVQPQPAAIR